MIKPDFTHLAVASFCDDRPSMFHFQGEAVYENLVWETTEYQKPSAEAVAAKLQQLEADWAAAEYQRKRMVEYPSVEDQFDLLYHGGYDAWKAAIKAVKDKHPKGQA